MQHDVPQRIITQCKIDGAELVQEALKLRMGSSVEFVHNVRGEQRRWLENAYENGKIALEARLASRSGMAERQDKLRQLLELDELPNRLECFDISHLSGESTVASCVVFGVEGAVKAEYRRFKITDITPGDDYAAMRQALTRRYTRLLKEGQRIPEVLFIDGGKGQVNIASEVITDLQLDTDMQIVGVAKGPARRPGEESLLLCRQGKEVHMNHDSPALHLIQQIRDEAHRYAVAGHRASRAKIRKKSVLEDISGLGPKRRKALLTHFGGIRATGLWFFSREQLIKHYNLLYHQPIFEFSKFGNMTLNIPTILTVARILLLPVIVSVFYMETSWARPLCCAIFLVAAITDWLDGYLARKWNVESEFGAFLDPVADKLMVATVLILIVEDASRWWITLPAIIIISREITISALREWMASVGSRAKVAVSYLGKLKTTLQITALAMLLYKVDLFGLPTYNIGVVALYFAAALTMDGWYIMYSFRLVVGVRPRRTNSRAVAWFYALARADVNSKARSPYRENQKRYLLLMRDNVENLLEAIVFDLKKPWPSPSAKNTLDSPEGE